MALRPPLVCVCGGGGSGPSRWPFLRLCCWESVAFATLERWRSLRDNNDFQLFFPCHTIGLVINLAKVGGVAVPSAPPFPAWAAKAGGQGDVPPPPPPVEKSAGSPMAYLEIRQGGGQASRGRHFSTRGRPQTLKRP